MTDRTLGKRGPAVTFGRWLAIGIGLPTLVLGCGIAPKSFRGVFSSAPITRARALSLGQDLPEAMVVPALIERLKDADAVVRMSANEELKQGTGQDFGFVAWGDLDERQRAVLCWEQWWKEREASLARPRRKE